MQKATELEPKKIREKQLSQPGGMMQVQTAFVRVRLTAPGELVPEGAEVVASDTPETDWVAE